MRHQDAEGNFKDECVEPPRLQLKGHLELRAGKKIQTRAVEVKARSSANTAIDNNFWQSAVPLLWAAYTAYEWERTNVEMEDGLLSDPTLENLLFPGAGSAARKTVRGVQQVASKLGPRLVNLGEKELATSSRILF